MTTLLSIDRIATALDAPTDALGMRHDRATRAALFAAIDAPSLTNWEAVRGIVCNEAGETLQGVIVRLRGSWYADALPSSFTILDALERSTK